MKNISLAIAVMWIATAVAVIFAIYTTKSAWCLWAMLIPACVKYNNTEKSTDECEEESTDAES